MPSKETLYLLEHSKEIEESHPGEFVAILGNDIVASGKSIHEVYAKTDDLGLEDPLVTYVPRPGEELLLI